jgi:tetratricopeptide (TPR) repeat protein
MPRIERSCSAARGNMPVVMPSGLPKEPKAQFDRAVATFRGEGPVCVNPQKLRVYLEDTRHIEAPPAQRLRWLAIALEHERLERGWDSLRTIYQAAVDAAPTDPWVLHSWGLSASQWVEGGVYASDPEERKAIADEAEGVLRAALELAPRDSRIAHTLGLLYYNHPAWTEAPEGYQSRAIDWFTRAIEWDPADVLAQLYLAHCFHDRKDWLRAIAEYEKVDLDRLARNWPAWRAVKCREQLAHCHAYAGHTDEAVRLFSAFLDTAASWDETQTEESIINLHELVDAVTHKLDHPELLRRTRDLVKRLAQDPRMRWLEKQYRQLLWP